jgi:hypothetical protein
MNSITETVVTIATAIVGVALLALIISRRSNTAGVIQALGSAFGNSLAVATSPVTGANVGINLGYPSSMGGFPTLN